MAENQYPPPPTHTRPPLTSFYNLTSDPTIAGQWHSNKTRHTDIAPG
jgi:hypothetical protein